MSEVKDDPREVLILLNSLGFVGITATQLKAFMKDLKIYRKIKDREKQQRREEMRAKIISKQEALIKEAYGHQKEEDSSNNIVPAESSNFCDNRSLVKVKIRYIPKEADEQSQKYSKATRDVTADERLTIKKDDKQDSTEIVESNRTCCERTLPNARSNPIITCLKNESRQNIPKCFMKDSCLIDKCKHNMRMEEQAKPVTVHEYPTNEPVLSDHVTRPRSKSVVSDLTGNVRTQSALSTRSSINLGQKSFIRPWRLQPEVQKSMVNKKCDPVALYQKYQQEWKQISFPGEAKHSKIRWAVREKMLGSDPHPVPLPKKSASMPILKRK